MKKILQFSKIRNPRVLGYALISLVTVCCLEFGWLRNSSYGVLPNPDCNGTFTTVTDACTSFDDLHCIDQNTCTGDKRDCDPKGPLTKDKFLPGDHPPGGPPPPPFNRIRLPGGNFECKATSWTCQLVGTICVKKLKAGNFNCNDFPEALGGCCEKP